LPRSALLAARNQRNRARIHGIRHLFHGRGQRLTAGACLLATESPSLAWGVSSRPRLDQIGDLRRHACGDFGIAAVASVPWRFSPSPVLAGLLLLARVDAAPHRCRLSGASVPQEVKLGSATAIGDRARTGRAEV